ncbi:uncharacterized protein UV8b_00198 [Ustilaginoidea virens]|uniref:Uncharacterized protein n=1 Tax=Ustilaginoidea virens TaxID=1159556 RepID=A0A8E5HIM9_USTVR|nr:uncharacterized protein UV8b_00198 [Ustilaginoidea virens]QUC15957.1 hypothetical protein UV8b_00198 [Ustilaginoidea virens]
MPAGWNIKGTKSEPTAAPRATEMRVTARNPTSLITLKCSAPYQVKGRCTQATSVAYLASTECKSNEQPGCL